MRLPLALLSACTSASFRNRHIVHSFTFGRSHRDCTGIIPSFRFRVSPTMSSSDGHSSQLNQPKRPRYEESSHSIMAFDLKNRSPYEKKMERVITACPKCNGEGKVRAPLSKKARAQRKRMQQSQTGDTTNAPNLAILKKPCKECDGSGLIAINPLDTTEREQTPPQIQPNFSVAIVGGGIGGIALAAALQHRNIPCIVYERDLSFEERKQGYGLTMQQGARALRSLGFFSFSDDGEDDNNNCSGKKAVDENTSNTKQKFGIHSTRHVVHKPDGTVVGEWGMKVWGGRFEKNGRKHAKRQNAHISRQNLRQLLMEMLHPGTIQWGHKFVGYSGQSSNDDSSQDQPSLQVRFRRRSNDCDEEVSTTASVLVGCDGIRSSVRSAKLGEDGTPLRYLDCIVILGIAPSPTSALTDGETVFQTADGITRLYVMPFAEAGDDSSGLSTDNTTGLSMWQLSFPMDETDATRLSQLGSSALKEEALKRCGTWHDPILKLLRSTPEDFITGYPCYDRALVERKELRDGCDKSQSANAFVTLLGDACHPMSPFKGQGANQALLDAVLLSQKLFDISRIHNGKTNVNEQQPTISLNESTPQALAEFENDMLQRCEVKVKKSADAAKFLHSDVAIQEGNITRGAAALDAKG